MAYTDIDKSSEYFETKLYTGTGATNSVTGVGFSPSMSWFKQSNTTRGHVLADIVRGAGNTLFPHDTSSETAGGFYLTSFDSDGFTLPSSNVGTNESGGTYASWNWLANGAGVSNTDGSITSTVSANTTSGFSIVSYTGTGSLATVGHGLGTTPSMIIAKRRSAIEDWGVYHKSMGASKYINLNTTTAEQSSTSRWNGTEPTSSVFSVNTHESVNANGDTYIAYCFAEKKGFSKFGSYTGNGNADGTFVYTGFKPAYVMIKQSNASGEGWFILDNKRETTNPMGTLLIANDSGADNTSQNPILDFTSNGFKLRRTWVGVNGSGATYIYMAFAENPLVGTNNIPTTAR